MTNRPVKGRGSSKAFPSLCSDIIPLLAVKATSKNNPIIPTGATCRPKATIRHTPKIPSNTKCNFSASVRA